MNTSRPLLLSPLRLLVALLVSVVAFTSGAGVAEAQNGVAAINPESSATVGAGTGIAAGHVGSEGLLIDDFTSGCCVAPSGLADDLVDLTSSSRRGHILDGEVRPNGTYGGGHRAGTGFPGKSEFPASWSDDQIMHYISDVATDPLSTTVRTQGRDVFVAGTRDRIDIEVLIRNGEIWTAYPTNVPRNPG